MNKKLAQVPVEKTPEVVTATPKKFKYSKTGDTVVAEKRPDILKMINEAGKKLKERLQERKIKIPEIVRVKHTLRQMVDAKTNVVRSTTERFHLKLKNGKEPLVNFSKFV